MNFKLAASLARVPKASRSSYLALAFQQALLFIVLVAIGIWIFLSHRAEESNASALTVVNDAAAMRIGTDIAATLGGNLAAVQELSESPAFIDDGELKANELLVTQLSGADSTKLANANVLGTFLDGPGGPVIRFAPRPQDKNPYLAVWQLTRGLPLRFGTAVGLVAKARRDALNQALSGRRDRLAVAEIDTLGRVILLAPYSTQLALSSWSLDNEIPGLAKVLADHRTTFLAHRGFLTRQGPFLTFVAPVRRREQIIGYATLVARRPQELSGIGEFSLSSKNGTELLNTWRDSPANPARRSVMLGGEPYELLTRDQPAASPSATLLRIGILAAATLTLVVLNTQEFSTLLYSFDSLEERRLTETRGLQKRLDDSRDNLEKQAQQLTHDLRNRANSLRHLQIDVLPRLSKDQTNRFDGLITDIDTYARDLSLKLVREALGYSQDEIAPVKTYLRGAIDTLSKQLAGGDKRIRISITFEGVYSGHHERPFRAS